jgi:hypothetical protein
MTNQPKKSCIKDTTYDPTCIGCEAVNDENKCVHGIMPMFCSACVPLDERSWENDINNYTKTAEHLYSCAAYSESQFCCLEKMWIKHFVRQVEHSARLSEREKVINKVKDLKEWYSGGGNKPIRDALDSVISSLSTPNELPHD